MEEDLVSWPDSGFDWIVVGWFTTDYVHLATKLAIQLGALSVPYHLFRREKSTDGWEPHQKPFALLRAMDTYQTLPLVLMDVDCIVASSPVAIVEAMRDANADVGIALKGRQLRTRRQWQKPIALTMSSRVVGIRPTRQARDFVMRWCDQCGRDLPGDDETGMAWAYLDSGMTKFMHLPPLYAGREVGDGERVTHGIMHRSARDRSVTNTIRERLKIIERRFFRTGRTKAQSRSRIG